MRPAGVGKAVGRSGRCATEQAPGSRRTADRSTKLLYKGAITLQSNKMKTASKVIALHIFLTSPYHTYSYHIYIPLTKTMPSHRNSNQAVPTQLSDLFSQNVVAKILRTASEELIGNVRENVSH